MPSDSREYLRSTFEEVAELYDRARPGYPAPLFDDLAAHASLPDAARILEIGCGTGQATIALAERGYQVTSVELGAQLAAIARRKLLREGGALAVIETEHVLPPGGDAIFAEMQDDYDAVLPDVDAEGPRHPDAVGDLCDEIEAGGFFRNALSRRYLSDVTYTADEYVAVLDTYSPHCALDDATRKRLHDRIRSRIEARPDRTVRKSYLATLNVARLRRAAAG